MPVIHSRIKDIVRTKYQHYLRTRRKYFFKINFKTINYDHDEAIELQLEDKL